MTITHAWVPVRALQLLVAAAALTLALAGCASSDDGGSDATAGCEALLDGRGFQGHLLVKQEPSDSKPGRFYCVFVEEQYRDADPTAQVPARQVLYLSANDSYTEAPTTVVVTADFAQAPAAR
jgi:hypothetical protein